MFLTELIQETEILPIFEKAQLLWNGFFALKKDDLDYALTVLSLLVFVIGPLKWIKNGIMKITAPYGAYIADIDSVLGKQSRKRIEKYYIPTRGQDVDPCDEEEIRENHGKYNTEELIPFLCKKAFSEDSFGKHYVILADSGMGKTTFLVNLYRYYVLKLKSRLKDRKYMRYIPLSSESCMEQIKEIGSKGKTILLLDALDENEEAMHNCDGFLRELLKNTEGFYKIVITCRTHFFSDAKDEPENTGLIRVGTGDKNLKFTKKYITPFSDREVNAYLRKRYRFLLKKQRKAREIVKKVPAIMARPLILNWIDCLVEEEKEAKYTHEIYRTIIDRWVKREPEVLTKGRLLELSQRIAKWMLDQKTTYIPAAEVERMALSEGIKLLPIVAKSHSLLNRNSKGDYKFAHRSFLEYFLSEQVYYGGLPYERKEYLSKMSGFGQFLVERIMRSNLAGLLSYKLDKDYVPIDKENIQGATNTISRYHYSFCLYNENQKQYQLGIVIISVTDIPKEDRVLLRKFEFVELRSDNPRTYPVMWCLRREPDVRALSKDTYAHLFLDNNSNIKYVYTPPIQMNMLFSGSLMLIQDRN